MARYVTSSESIESVSACEDNTASLTHADYLSRYAYGQAQLVPRAQQDSSSSHLYNLRQLQKQNNQHTQNTNICKCTHQPWPLLLSFRQCADGPAFVQLLPTRRTFSALNQLVANRAKYVKGRLSRVVEKVEWRNFNPQPAYGFCWLKNSV